jgi:hypothetical protein
VVRDVVRDKEEAGLLTVGGRRVRSERSRTNEAVYASFVHVPLCLFRPVKDLLSPPHPHRRAFSSLSGGDQLACDLAEGGGIGLLSRGGVENLPTSLNEGRGKVCGRVGDSKWWWPCAVTPAGGDVRRLSVVFGLL